MTNDETRMTKEARMTKPQETAAPETGSIPLADRKERRRRRLRWFVMAPLAILVVLYAVLLTMALGCADKLLFQPHRSSYQDRSGTLKLTTADGTKITALYLPSRGSRYTILYSHGNAEDLGNVLNRLAHLRDLGFSVLAYDYHGYGTSEGVPSEAAAYADVDAAYEYITGQLKVPPQNVILYGRSVGGGPSVDLATRRRVGGLVLQGAFTTAFRVSRLGSLVPGDRFRNIQKIPSVHCPVLVMHGSSDWTVPYSHGLELFAAANDPKRCLWVQGAGHNDLVDVAGPRYDQAMRELTELMENQVQGKNP